MSQDKIESRRAFLSNLAKAAGVAAFAAPLMAGDLCFSKETLDQIEGDLDKIQIKDGHSDSPKAGPSCDCYECCGSSYAIRGTCECYKSCGRPNYSSNGICDCYVTCGSSNYSMG